MKSLKEIEKRNSGLSTGTSGSLWSRFGNNTDREQEGLDTQALSSNKRGNALNFSGAYNRQTEKKSEDQGGGITDWGNDQLNDRYIKTVLALHNIQQKSGTDYDVIEDAKSLMGTYIGTVLSAHSLFQGREDKDYLGIGNAEFDRALEDMVYKYQYGAMDAGQLKEALDNSGYKGRKQNEAETKQNVISRAQELGYQGSERPISDIARQVQQQGAMTLSAEDFDKWDSYVNEKGNEWLQDITVPGAWTQEHESRLSELEGTLPNMTQDAAEAYLKGQGLGYEFAENRKEDAAQYAGLFGNVSGILEKAKTQGVGSLSEQEREVYSYALDEINEKMGGKYLSDLTPEDMTALDQWGKAQGAQMQDAADIYQSYAPTNEQKYMLGLYRQTLEGAQDWVNDAAGTEEEDAANDNLWRVERKTKFDEVKTGSDFEQNKTAQQDFSSGNAAFDHVYRLVNDIGYDRLALDMGGATTEYIFMTDEEKDIFNALANGGKYQDAKDYLEYISYDLHARQNEKAKTGMQKMAESGTLGEAAASALSVPFSLMSGAGFLDAAAQHLTNKLSGYQKPVDYERMALPGTLAETARETVQEQHDWNVNIGGKDVDVFDFLYGTAMSGVDSAAAAAFGGLKVAQIGKWSLSAGAAMLGLGAAQSAMEEAKNNGASDGQALLMGTVAGIFESLFEKISIGKFYEEAKHLGKRSVKEALKNVAAQAGINFSEEFFTELADMTAENIILGEKGQTLKQREEYIRLGATEEEADQMTARDIALRLGEAGIGGALMGGAFGVVSNVTSDAYTRRADKQTGSLIKPDTKQSIKSLAEKLGGNAAELAATYDPAKAKDSKTGQLFRAVAEQLPEEMRGTVKKAAMLDILETENDVSEEAVDAIADMLLGRELSPEQVDALAGDEAGMRAVNKLFGVEQAAREEAKNQEAPEKAERQAQENAGQEEEAVALESVTPEENAEESVSGPIMRAGENGENITQFQTDEAGGVEARTESGEAKDLDEMGLSDEQKIIAREAADLPAAAQAAMANNYQGGDAAAYAKGMKQVYRAAARGISGERIKSLYGESLTQEQRRAAFMAGREEYNQRTNQDEKLTRAWAEKLGFNAIQDAESENAAGLYFARVRNKTISETTLAQLRLLDEYAKQNGVHVNIYDHLDENGNYRTGTNRINLALDAEGNLITRTASHELFHFMQEWNRDEGAKLQKFVLDILKETEGFDYQERLEEISKTYKDKNGQDLSLSDAEEEMAAEAVLDVLGTEENMRKFIKQEPQTVVEKFVAWVKEMAEKLRKALEGLAWNHPEVRAMLQNADRLTEIAEMYDAALKTAGDNYRAAQAGMNQAAQQDEAVQKYAEDMRTATNEGDRTAAVNGLIADLFSKYAQAVNDESVMNDWESSYQKFADALASFGRGEKNSLSAALQAEGLPVNPQAMNSVLSYAARQAGNITDSANMEALKMDEAESEGPETHYGDNKKFSHRVTDEKELDFLNGQKTIKTYRSMQLIDGKLYPPMAAVVSGSMEDSSELGQWEKATEHPELIRSGNKFRLNKGQGKGSLDAAYNPYMHSSNLMINDQFSGAYDRPNLVTVECEVPESEATSGYHAEYAKDDTGWHNWNAGPVATKLRQQKDINRQVFLSRWIKPVRIVSDTEVAQHYKELMAGTDIEVPDNVVSPSLKAALEEAGVPVKESGRVKYSIRQLADGTKYVEVDTDQEIFEGKTVKEMPAILQKYIKTHFMGRVIGTKENKAYVNSRSAGEYSHPGKNYEDSAYEAKLRAGTELDNLMDAAVFVKHGPPEARHPEFPNGWDIYNVPLHVMGNWYNARISVGIDEQTRRRFYEANVSEIESTDTAFGSVRFITPPNSTSAFNSSISNFDEDVNSKLSLRASDAEYMSAVEDGDEETAQRMADEAAKAAGYDIHAYHGTARGDRVGNVFRPERATSGPMAFFTSDRSIAENYARDKADTSLDYAEEYDGYYNQFRTKTKDGATRPVQDAWNQMTYAEKRRVENAAKHITWDDELENIIYSDSATRGNGGFDAYLLREHKGNAIEALIDSWLESGELYGQEEAFLDVLRLAGIENVEYFNPDERNEKVYDTYLKIEKPFKTESMYNRGFVNGLLAWWGQQDQEKYRRTSASADMWDKNNMTVDMWAGKALDDLEKGTTHAWTSIPDGVTDYLKSLGYDGIIDQGGKNGGAGHTVYIPFSGEQVKDAAAITYDDNGNVIPLSERFNQENNDIRYSARADADAQAERQAMEDIEDDPELYAEMMSDGDSRAALMMLNQLHRLVTRGGEDALIKKGAFEKRLSEIASKIETQTGTKYGHNKLMGNLRKIYQAMEQSGYSMGETLQFARSIMRNVLEESPGVLVEQDEATKEVIRVLKNRPFSLTQDQKNEIQNTYGTLGAYTRKNFGKMKIRSGENTNATLYDVWMEDLNPLFPGTFSADTSELDMPGILDAWLEGANEKKFNGEYGANIGKYSTNLALNAMLDFFDVPGALKSKGEIRQEYQETILSQETRIRQLTETARGAAEQAKLQYEEKYRQRIEKAQARREETERKQTLRNQIIRDVKGINALNTRMTDNSHVPEELRAAALAAVKPFIGNVGVFEGAAQIRLSHQYALFAERAGEIGGFDEDILTTINGLEGKLNGRRLSQLSEAELQDLADVMGNIRHIINESNTAFLNGRKTTVDAMSGRLKADMQAKGTARQGKAASLARALSLKETTPVYFADRVGGVVKEMIGDLYKGQNTWAFTMSKAKGYADEQIKAYHVNEWINDKEHARFVTQHGDQIELNRSEAMTIYALWNRETKNKLQNANHLRVGGFLYAKGTKYEGVNTMQPHPLTESDMQAIRGYLTEEQKAFADKMVQYLSEDIAAIGNETSMRMYGYKKFTEKYYFPYTTDSRYLVGDLTQSGEKVQQPKNAGITKALMQNAANPLTIGNFMDIWAGHINQMGLYAGFAETVDTMSRVFNQRIAGEMKTDAATGEQFVISPESNWMEMERAIGAEGVKYLKTLVRDISGGVRTDERGFGGKALSLFKKGSVAGNLSVVVQQPTAYMRAMALVNPQYLLSSNPAKLAQNIRNMYQYSGVALIKDMGRFDTGTGKGAVEWLKGGIKDENAWKRALDVVDKVTGKGAEKADEWTWGILWGAIEKETEHTRPDLKTGTEEFYRATAERFEDVVNHTQVYDSVLSKSEWMRSGTFYDKMVTSFMAEPTLTLNMLMDSVVNYKTNGGAKKVARAASAFLLTAAVNALAKSLITATRRKDDEGRTWLEKYIADSAGNFMDDVSPYGLIGMIPWARDAVSLLEGYSVERSDMDAIEQLVNAWKVLNNDKKSTEDKIWTAADAVSNMFGIPVKNLRRDMEALVRNLFMGGSANEATTGRDVMYSVMDKTGLALPFTGNGFGAWDSSRSAYYDRMEEALKKGDTAKYEELRGYVEETLGVKPDTVTEGITKEIQASVKGGLMSDEKALKLLDTLGIEKQKAFDKVNQWTQEAAHADEEDYDYKKYGELADLIEKNADIQAETKRLNKYGVTQKNVDDNAKKAIKELYQAGKIDEKGAESRIKKYLGITDPDDIHWLLDEWAYKRDNGSDASYSRYVDVFDAVKNGTSLTMPMKEMTDNGYKEKEVRSEIRSQIGEWYRKGEMTKSEAEQKLRTYAGITDKNDVYWAMDEWDYKKANAGNKNAEEYGKYKRFLTAVETGRNLSSEIERYLNHGVSKETLSGQITTAYKEQYVKLYNSGSYKAEELKSRLLRAFEVMGYTRAEKDKAIRQWLKEKKKKQ